MSTATLILVIITGYYAYITNRIAKIASTQLKLSQRPYINIDNISESSLSADETILSVAVKYSNKSNVAIKIEKFVVLVENKAVSNNGKTQTIAPEKDDLFNFPIDLMSDEKIAVIIHICYKSVFDSQMSYTQMDIKMNRNNKSSQERFVQMQYKSGYLSEKEINKRVCD